MALSRRDFLGTAAAAASSLFLPGPSEARAQSFELPPGALVPTTSQREPILLAIPEDRETLCYPKTSLCIGKPYRLVDGRREYVNINTSLLQELRYNFTEPVALASAFKPIVMMLYLLLSLRRGETIDQDTISSMIVNSDNDATGNLLARIGDLYKAEFPETKENPIEIFNSLLMGLSQVMKGQNLELSMDATSGRLGIYKWEYGATNTQDMKDQRKSENENTGPRIPMEFMTQLWSDIYVFFSGSAESTSFAEYYSQLFNSELPSDSQQRLDKIYDVIMRSDSGEGISRKRILENWRNDIQVDLVETQTISKIGSINGLWSEAGSFQLGDIFIPYAVSCTFPTLEEPDFAVGLAIRNQLISLLGSCVEAVGCEVKPDLHPFWGKPEGITVGQFGLDKMVRLPEGPHHITFTDGALSAEFNDESDSNAEKRSRLPLTILVGEEPLKPRDRAYRFGDLRANTLHTGVYSELRFQHILLENSNLAFYLPEEYSKELVEVQFKEMIASKISSDKQSVYLADLSAWLDQWVTNQTYNYVTFPSSSILVLLAMFPHEPICQRLFEALAFTPEVLMYTQTYTLEDWQKMKNSLNSVGGYIQLLPDEQSVDLLQLFGIDLADIDSDFMCSGGQYILACIMIDALIDAGFGTKSGYMQLEHVVNGLNGYKEIRKMPVRYNGEQLPDLTMLNTQGLLLFRPNPSADPRCFEGLLFGSCGLGHAIELILLHCPSAEIYIADLSYQNWLQLNKTDPNGNTTQLSVDGDSVVAPPGQPQFFGPVPSVPSV